MKRCAWPVSWVLGASPDSTKIESSDWTTRIASLGRGLVNPMVYRLGPTLLMYTVRLSESSSFSRSAAVLVLRSRSVMRTSFSRFGRLISVPVSAFTSISTLGCTVSPCSSGLRTDCVST